MDLDQLKFLVALTQGQLLVSILFANSETGVIQPIAAIAALLANRPHTTFHSDAAQAFGKLPIDLSPGVGPDVITVSGHKPHAPMGVGAIPAISGTAQVPALSDPSWSPPTKQYAPLGRHDPSGGCRPLLSTCCGR